MKHNKWVELCLGQLPNDVDKMVVAALLTAVCPPCRILRIMGGDDREMMGRGARGRGAERGRGAAHQGGGGGDGGRGGGSRARGVCFCIMRDDGAAPLILHRLLNRIWFHSDKQTILIAKNSAARKLLQFRFLPSSSSSASPSASNATATTNTTATTHTTTTATTNNTHNNMM